MAQLVEATLFWYVVAVVISVLVLLVGKLSTAANRQAATSDEIPATADRIFILIHGTWARNAAWTRAGSPLRRQLGEGSPGVGFRAHGWSGRNTERARRNAAERLGEAIATTKSAFPCAQLVLIAHSHGGNVALMSLTPAIASQVDALICLATPVLVKRRKEADWLTGFFLRWFAVPPAFIAGGIIEDAYSSIPEGLLLFTLPGLAALVMVWLRTRVWNIGSESDFSHLDSARVLFVRAPGDEAALVIGTSNMVALALERMITAPMAGVGKSIGVLDDLWHRMREKSLTWLVSFALAVVLAVALEASSEAPQGPPSDRIPTVMFGFALLWVALRFLLLFKVHYILLLPAFGLAALLLPPMLLAIALLAAVSLGPETALAVTTSSITAEVCPPGTWTVAHVVDSGERGSQPTLQHSSVYASPKSLDIVERWLNRALVATGAGTPRRM